MRGSVLRASVNTLASAQARALSRLGVGLLAVVAACAVADANACTRRAATEIAAFGCEPYARAAWMPAATRGSLGGTPFALGLARLNRTGVQMTGHDPDEAAVVPVVSLRPSREVGVAVMPTLRDGEVGAAVIVSLRVGR